MKTIVLGQVRALVRCSVTATALLALLGTSGVVHSSEDVLPIRHDAVVLQVGLGKVRLKGPIVLDAPVNDLDDSYLAHRAVDEGSLPASIRRKQGRRITAFRRDGTTCNPILRTVAAYGWAMPDGTDWPSWEGMSERQFAEKVFMKGTKILAAEIDLKDCSGAIWATLESPSALRFRPAYAAPDNLRVAALAAMPHLPVYSKWQTEYDRFKVQEEAKLRGAGVAPSAELLPDHWTSLRPLTRFWVIDGGAEKGTLLIGYIRAGERGFFGSMVAVWSVADRKIAALTFLGPDNGAGAYEDFNLDGAVSVVGGLPLLVYSTNVLSGGMRPINGHYRVDSSIGVAPAR